MMNSPEEIFPDKLPNYFLEALAEDTVKLRAWPDGTHQLDDVGCKERWKFIERFSFAIPDNEALRRIARLGPIVEFGAGTGYWAACLKQAGADIIAYEPSPYDNEYGFNRRWFPTVRGDHTQVVKHLDRTLFVCWPCRHTSWPHELLRAYLSGGGQRVVYIGEDRRGCTGTPVFHDILNTQFKCVDDYDIPRWIGMHDFLSIWERK